MAKITISQLNENLINLKEKFQYIEKRIEKIEDKEDNSKLGEFQERLKTFEENTRLCKESRKENVKICKESHKEKFIDIKTKFKESKNVIAEISESVNDIKVNNLTELKNDLYETQVNFNLVANNVKDLVEYKNKINSKLITLILTILAALFLALFNNYIKPKLINGALDDKNTGAKTEKTITIEEIYEKVKILETKK